MIVLGENVLLELNRARASFHLCVRVIVRMIVSMRMRVRSILIVIMVMMFMTVMRVVMIFTIGLRVHGGLALAGKKRQARFSIVGASAS